MYQSEYHGAIKFAELAPKWKDSYYSVTRHGDTVMLSRDGTLKEISLDAYEMLTKQLVKSGVPTKDWWKVIQQVGVYANPMWSYVKQLVP